MELARVIKAGMCIEASCQRGKGEAGMDAYQVRTWEGWHHHMALTLIAVWFLISETHRRQLLPPVSLDRKSTRLNSSHVRISYAVFCLKKKKNDPVTLYGSPMTNIRLYVQCHITY